MNVPLIFWVVTLLMDHDFEGNTVLNIDLQLSKIIFVIISINIPTSGKVLLHYAYGEAD
jgi:hypothetical protein